jgi:PAS domain S-box-containing protein
VSGRESRPDQAALRLQAEAAARARAEWAPEHLEALSPEAARRTLHELRVHQIELEMQAEELRRAQGELDAARALYFDLYDLAPVGYCTVDERGMILQANLTAASLLGVARGALVEQLLTRFIAPADHATFARCRRQLLDAGGAGSCELRMLRHDRSAFWAFVTATAARDAGGEPAVRMVMSDVTAQKDAERERARLESELQHARRLESVGHLAGGVAHDFNNMLGVILGYAEFGLRQVEPGNPLWEVLSGVHNAAARSADLTRQLLAFARKQPVTPAVLDLNETLRGSLRLLKRLIGENVEIALRPEPALWAVKIDPSQMDQILANLCINARDAIAGVGRVDIETANCAVERGAHPDAAPGEYVRLVVRDTGCGMDRESLAHVFDPFFTTKGVGQGTGLGLATVYGAVRQGGGFITAESEPGRGATFSVHLPRHLGAAPPLRAATRPAPAPRGRETLLVVEDEPALLHIITRHLESLGYVVLAAGGPAEALRLARDHDGAIDLLLTDVIMPEMNGQGLARELMASRPQLRCLFMSGYTADVIAKSGVLDEGLCFVEKPFSMDDLATEICEALDAGREG